MTEGDGRTFEEVGLGEFQFGADLLAARGGDFKDQGDGAGAELRIMRSPSSLDGAEESAGLAAINHVGDERLGLGRRARGGAQLGQGIGMLSRPAAP